MEKNPDQDQSPEERPSFWEAYERFRREQDPDLELDPDEIFADVRDPSPGRDFRWP